METNAQNVIVDKKEKKLRRVTVIMRVRWVKSSIGGHTVDDYSVLYNMTDKKLAAKLEEMNKPYRSNFWEVVHDFNMKRRSDQAEYLKYCVDCAYNPHNKDIRSAEVGEKIIAAIF